MKPFLVFIFLSISMQAQNIIHEKDILDTLDKSNQSSPYCWFLPLGHPYSYLVDCRLNIFRSDNAKWAIVAERLGYNPRGGYIELELYYYGNCLENLEQYNGSLSNNYIVYPIDNKNFETSTDGEILNNDASFWLIRENKIPLTRDKGVYERNNIHLNEDEPGEIRIEEAARLIIKEHNELFRATDTELYKCIPKELKKVMVIDEWYHKDYNHPALILSDEEQSNAYELNKALLERNGMNSEDFFTLMENQNKESKKMNEDNYTNNRPSSYETWQLIAKVISQNSPELYKPTLKPNTHWKNWPDSGSL